MARAHAAEAIETLVEIMLNKKASPSSRTLAAIALLDRGYGKPKQELEISRRPLKEMSDEELLAIAQSGEDVAGPEDDPGQFH